MRGGAHASTPARGTPGRRGRSPRATKSSTPPLEDGIGLGSARPNATFTTCLSIPVQGATPIEPSDAPQESRMGAASTQASAPPARRAARKSKLEALAALQNRENSSSPEPDDMNGANGTQPGAVPIAVPTGLDMSLVKTTSPRHPPSPHRSRPFGLKECPTYYPSPEEFKDPMAYISSIYEEAAQHGICKVVPPADWSMPFVTDTENFRFKTRLQRLNSIEASSRAQVNFLEQLYRFHKQQGNPRVSVPTINHKALDLWLLRKEVHKLGGYEEVNRTKKWADLGRILGYTGVPGLSAQLKNSYSRVILPYEDFCERVRNSPALSPVKNSGESHLRTALAYQTALKMSNVPLMAKDDPEEKVPVSPTPSSPLSDVTDEYFAWNKSPGRSKVARTDEDEDMLPSLGGTTAGTEKKSTSEQSCEVCHKKNRGEEMLLCDGCDCGYHMFCLDPPLQIVPKGEWFCHICLFGTGGDYGFDEGEEHNLASFHARDSEFRRMWFTSHPPPQVPNREREMGNKFDNTFVSEYDVEDEFWRLVQSQVDTVEIEYGADVHSTTHGSAMPTLETHPLNPYAKDPWNLSNLPILSQSLLRYIKSDISGMTVPWTYVGMVFSTFCWHNEDHYTYSINYMHWGETKTWYGIPGEDAEKFEAAIKQEAPDLFDAQPDLLYQLVTLMNPERLTAAGVRVRACNQRAGEFVITFPKAYHAGFNHGLNFNEAVNFALPNWLPLGRSCVQQYREYRKQPVFSHDELLVTVTQQSDSVETALWLIDSLREMVDREIAGRRTVRAMNVAELLEEEDRAEDQYGCAVCKVFCYLSQVTCRCTKQVVCFDHLASLCQCAMDQKTLRTRFSDETLLDTLAHVERRAAAPDAWRASLVKTLSVSSRPQLDDLISLLVDGEQLDRPPPELAVLRKCINRARQWTTDAALFLEGTHGDEAVSTYRPAPSRRFGDLRVLQHEVVDLGFESPVIEALEALYKRAEDADRRANDLLRQVKEDGRDAHLSDCEALLQECTSLSVYIDALVQLQKIVGGRQVMKELKDVLAGDTPLSLAGVKDLLFRAEECGISAEDENVVTLSEKEAAGEDWSNKATRLLQGVTTLADLDACLAVDSCSTPVDTVVFDRVKSARIRAEEFERQANLWLSVDARKNKPRIQDAYRLATRSEQEFSLPAVTTLRKTAEVAQDLENRCEEVILNRYQHRQDGDAFQAMREWRSYAHKNLAMFTLPHFEMLEGALQLHYAWITQLPWYHHELKSAIDRELMQDVADATEPDDDVPPEDEYYSCICMLPVRRPPEGTRSDAVQCDHCCARFHGACANHGQACPFCDEKVWDGTFAPTRRWHFSYLPTFLLSAPEITRRYAIEYRNLQVIIRRVDRLVATIVQTMTFISTPEHHRGEYIPLLRHYMRKLLKLGFVVSPNPHISLGLELSKMHRSLATGFAGPRPGPGPAPRAISGPAPSVAAPSPGPASAQGSTPARPMRKRRRPKFTFGQDQDKDWVDGTRCICRGRTAYYRDGPKVECETCSRWYHTGCVFYPEDAKEGGSFICPICCLKKMRPYSHAEVRVRDPKVTEPNVYVDITNMILKFSKNVVFVHMAPPFTKTLFVELNHFVPGQPEYAPVPLPPSSHLPPPSHPQSPYTNGHGTGAPPSQRWSHGPGGPPGLDDGQQPSPIQVPRQRRPRSGSGYSASESYSAHPSPRGARPPPPSGPDTAAVSASRKRNLPAEFVEEDDSRDGYRRRADTPQSRTSENAGEYRQPPAGSHHSSTSSARGPPSLSPSPALYSHNERPMRE